MHQIVKWSIECSVESKRCEIYPAFRKEPSVSAFPIQHETRVRSSHDHRLLVGQTVDDCIITDRQTCLCRAAAHAVSTEVQPTVVHLPGHGELQRAQCDGAGRGVQRDCRQSRHLAGLAHCDRPRVSRAGQTGVDGEDRHPGVQRFLEGEHVRDGQEFRSD